MRAAAYIPMDRRQALARGESLPERARGSALFADISGFTPLTEALARELGASRGAEELTRHLNRVYDVLITELHRFRGSVISFSGDAITCWFEGDDATRAVTCALAMQQAMAQLGVIRTAGGASIALGMKAAVATGTVRRFVVGDPAHCLMDAMAGDVLDRLAATESMAEMGQVVLDATSLDAMGDRLTVDAWRIREDAGERYGVIADIMQPAPPDPWPELAPDALPDELVHGWLLPAVLERLETGQGEFLAELRPAVALFLQFSGISYDTDPHAADKLDQFVQKVQAILGRYDGSLLNLTIGDKGSYLFASFGAPIAHEDDAARALSVALELCSLNAVLGFLDPLKIGVTTGLTRAGAYGSVTRRAYSVLGEAVNLSARLMAAAEPGQILVSMELREKAGKGLAWEDLAPIRVKGRREPVAVTRLVGRTRSPQVPLFEPRYALPMVGRQAELDAIDRKLALVLQGHGQIVGVTAEAGMGKSRLAAEIIARARQAGLACYGGECQSYGTATGYLVWRSIWRSLLAIDPDLPPEELVASLETHLHAADPALLPRLSLLGAVLNVSLPENDLTRSLDAKVRKSSLEGLLVDYLRARASKQPLLLVLEDCHWLDALSHDLVEEIGRAIAGMPVLLLLVYRPTDAHGFRGLRVRQFAHFSEIVLTELDRSEAYALIRQRLQRFHGYAREAPESFVAQIADRAAGNPFYMEELLNYLHGQGVDPTDVRALATIELPASLHSLVLSRMDQLTEQQRTTMKVASVIGRLFPAAMVWGAYPELGPYDQVKADLQVLSELDIAPLDTPEPELAYLFKHIITQEVAYESLLHATRAILHEQIGFYIERTQSDRIDQYVSVLAHHFDRSNNLDKRRTYLLRAGQVAQANYANKVAIGLYEKAVPLLTPQIRGEALVQLGKVLELTGDWKEADRRYREAFDLAVEGGDRSGQAWCQTAIGELYRKQGQFEQAATWLQSAYATFDALENSAGMGQALHYEGTLADQQGDFARAQTLWEESLAIRRRLDDRSAIGGLLSNLGIVAARQGDLDTAQALLNESLRVRREINDRWAVAVTLNNLGFLALLGEQPGQARAPLEEALALQREIGDRWMIGNALNNLGNVARDQARYEDARALYAESLGIYDVLGDLYALAYLLEDSGRMAALQGQARQALCLAAAASALREKVGAPLSTSEAEQLDAALACARDALGPDAEAAWMEGLGMELSEVIAYALGPQSRGR